MKKSYLPKQFVYIIALALLLSNPVFSQVRNCDYVVPHMADTWIFGINARINFTTNPPEIVPTALNYGMPFGTSTISDKYGNILLFTNGETVWNKSNQTMQNGTGLKGYKYGGQSSIIVPHPGNSNQYFIFTTNLFIPTFKTDGINYSTVDFSNNSLGEITSKNNLLLSENSKTICAVKHHNGIDYWVIVHGFGQNKGNKFYTFLVDTSGVANTPIESTTGYFQSGDISNQTGYMKASSNGAKLALSVPFDGVVEILDFNNETGVISNPITSNVDYLYIPVGIEFSPDNTKLYVTTSPINNDTSYLLQFDLTSNQPFTNPTAVNKFAYFGTTSDSTMQGIQLSVDGKIYVTKTKQSGVQLPNLGVIYNPNRPGMACNYNELDYNSNNGLFLNGAGSQAGLPDFVSSFLDIPHFYYLNQCLNDETNFIIRNTANLEPTWDFKDPNGISLLVDPMNPIHVFSEPETYNVVLTETYDGIDYIFSESVIINPLPSIEIGQGSDIVYILPGSSIRLDAGEGMDVYSWNPGGSSSQYLDVVEEGIYIATVTDFNCCTNSDTVEIKYASLSYPTAFKPGSSVSENSTFGVVGNLGAISKYQIRIFNRWGQMIFETDNPLEGWDGNQDGSAAPMGTYIYSSVFTSFESGIQSSIDIKNTGTVTLIR